MDPFIIPIIKPSTSISTTVIKPPLGSIVAAIIPEPTIIEPTDKSMLPIKTGNVSPVASIKNIEARTRISIAFL